MAAEITMTFLEKNTFHFQDARLGMREFLNTPFPCGHKPRDYVRDIVICVRCEGPVNQHDRYMWGDEEDYDGVWGSLQEFPWKEDGLYYNLRCQNEFLQELELANKLRITLAIVTQFVTSRRKRANYYDHVDVPRIELNLLEVVLPAYRHLRDSGSRVNIVKVGPKRAEDPENWQEGWNYKKRVTVTWQAELMDEVYSGVGSFSLRYPRSKLTSHLVTEDALFLSGWSPEDEDAHEAGKADQEGWCATPTAGE
jgi:hypothetical protein